jgi:hypothetical protein
MKREEEVSIIIKNLVEDVGKTAREYPSLLEDLIVKNGSLIESYKNENEKKIYFIKYIPNFTKSFHLSAFNDEDVLYHVMQIPEDGDLKNYEIFIQIY